MRVRRKDDGVGHSGTKLRGDVGLSLGPDFVHDPVPLAIGETGCVLPAFDLALEARVRPEMMAVSGDVQPIGIGGQASGEERLEAQSWVLNDHNSGKARFSSVERR